MAKNSEKTFSSNDGSADPAGGKEDVTAPVEETKEEDKPSKKIYGGPTIVSLGISKGTTYCGIPKGVPEYMHFMFLPIAEYRATVQSAAFIKRCTEAVKKMKEA